MAIELARKFAEVSLSLYAEERTFEIGISNPEELEPIAQAFEQMGCTVERDVRRGRLTVHCGD
jgi:hypothetical protein